MIILSLRTFGIEESVDVKQWQSLGRRGDTLLKQWQHVVICIRVGIMGGGGGCGDVLVHFGEEVMYQFR